MQILPAVDIRGGLCVNLIQGDYAEETVFSDDPVAQARTWRDQGGPLIHIVDLDGAKAGRCCVEETLHALREAGVRFEIGGGVRSLDAVSRLVELGAARVVLGTAAHDDPDFLKEAVSAFPDKIVVGIDAKDGKVAVNAWVDVTATEAVDFAMRMEQVGVQRIVYTDILSDGMMKGPNTEATQELARSVRIPVTASGGVSSLADLNALHAIESDGVDEVIVGRALYLKAFSLQEAIAAVGIPT